MIEMRTWVADVLACRMILLPGLQWLARIDSIPLRSRLRMTC